MSTRRSKPQPPVVIPERLHHGSSYVYRWYKCRCRRCLAWRREYDSKRPGRDVRSGLAKARREGRAGGGWYVCVDLWPHRWGTHDYENGICVRCQASQAVEEHWESKWQETES
jgi:hypothetical protein